MTHQSKRVTKVDRIMVCLQDGQIIDIVIYNRLKMIGLIIPPGEIKKLLQRTAEYVAVNGSEFQTILMTREQHKPQFAFLKNQNPYRAYYDHKVAEISKKLIQGITEQPKEQTKINNQSTVVKEEAGREQESFLEKIFTQLKEPDPQKYIAEFPQKITEAEVGMIQHTAQYAAKNGKNFLLALSEREKNNPQFEFLRTSSKHHGYFMGLVTAYTYILQLQDEELNRLTRLASNPQEAFEKCRLVFDYHQAKQQQSRGKKEQTNKQVKQSNIDWNDFELVETISFDTDHKSIGEGELIARIQQHASMIPKSMEEKIISEPKKREILQQCHACRQNILASEMNKHLKTCLAQKKKPQQSSQTYGEEVDIRRNLESLSSKRPDIFGTVENKIVLEEEAAERVIFDGQASNLSRTTGGVAMLHFQQKRLKEELEKNNK